MTLKEIQEEEIKEMFEIFFKDQDFSYRTKDEFGIFLANSLSRAYLAGAEAMQSAMTVERMTERNMAKMSTVAETAGEVELWNSARTQSLQQSEEFLATINK
jgi:hypothetical protein